MDPEVLKSRCSEGHFPQGRHVSALSLCSGNKLIRKKSHWLNTTEVCVFGFLKSTQALSHPGRSDRIMSLFQYIAYRPLEPGKTRQSGGLHQRSLIGTEGAHIISADRPQPGAIHVAPRNCSVAGKREVHVYILLSRKDL